MNENQDRFDEFGERIMPVQPVQYVGPKNCAQTPGPSRYGGITLTQSSDGVNMHVTHHKRIFDEPWIGSLFSYIYQYGYPLEAKDDRVSVGLLLAAQWVNWGKYIRGSGENKIYRN